MKSMPPLSSVHSVAKNRGHSSAGTFCKAVPMIPTRPLAVLCVARTVKCSVHAFVSGSTFKFIASRGFKRIDSI